MLALELYPSNSVVEWCFNINNGTSGEFETPTLQLKTAHIELNSQPDLVVQFPKILIA